MGLERDGVPVQQREARAQGERLRVLGVVLAQDEQPEPGVPQARGGK